MAGNPQDSAPKPRPRPLCFTPAAPPISWCVAPPHAGRGTFALVNEPGALSTAIVGAGPAGLAFAAIGKLLHDRAGDAAGPWELRLYDKRQSYVRTHRLRIGREPYEAIAADLRDPRFDALLSFLRDEDFRPEVNRLEERLSALVDELGIAKETLEIEGLSSIRDLVERHRPRGRVTIVGADSVHSAVREATAASASGHRHVHQHVHQHVARLRVLGPGLPVALGPVAQVRLSKIIGSVVDYRLNTHGFAEVDLFLDATDHAALRALGAAPKEPVRIVGRTLAAPLLRRIVERLEQGFGAGPCEVLLASSFVLEHRITRDAMRTPDGLDATVFLVGDAALSLPYFRGMAALGSAAHALAHAHVDLSIADKRRASPALRAEDEAEIARSFRAEDRPRRFGAWLLPGTIADVRPTVWHGAPAFAVLHRFGGRWGAHVFEKRRAGPETQADEWIAHEHLAPVQRAVAEHAFEAWSDPARRYGREVEEIASREVAIVRARGRLIRLLREVARTSAILPFPIQTWLLSAPDDRPTTRPSSRAVALNAALATTAAALALVPPALGAHAWLALLSLPVQALGGIAYHAVVTLDRGPARAIRHVWRTQTLVLVGTGLPLAIHAAVAGTVGLALVLAFTWLVLAAMFVVGLYAWERVVSRWMRTASVD